MSITDSGSIPKTPEREIGQQCLGGGKWQRNAEQLLIQPLTGMQTRTEKIADDTLEPRSLNGITRKAAE